MHFSRSLGRPKWMPPCRPQESKQTEACADVILLGLYLLAAFHLGKRLRARNARTIQEYGAQEPSGELFRLLPGEELRIFTTHSSTTFAIFRRREPWKDSLVLFRSRFTQLWTHTRACGRRELKNWLLCGFEEAAGGGCWGGGPLKLGLLLELRCEEPFCAAASTEGHLKGRANLLILAAKLGSRIVPRRSPFSNLAALKSISTCLLCEMVWAKIFETRILESLLNTLEFVSNLRRFSLND